MTEVTTMAHANEFPTVNQGSDGRVIIEMSNADGASTSRKQEDDVTMEMEDMISNTDVASTSRQQEDDVIMEMENTMSDTYGTYSTSTQQEDDIIMETEGGGRLHPRKNKAIRVRSSRSWDSEGLVITRIPKVPQGHGYGVRDAYEPSIISIGPYHRGKPRLQPMEMLKRKCFDRLQDRRRTIYSLEECIHKVNPQEMKARTYYSENTEELESKEFVEMMLFDACFIIEYSICVRDGSLSELVNNRIWMDIAVRNDLLLLENQLPFFVVKHIYQIFINDHFDELMCIVQCFCRHVSPINTYELSGKAASVHHWLAQHLLHIYHWFLFSSTEEKDEKEKEDRDETSRINLFRPEKPICTIRSATFLQEAGIKFRKKMQVTTSIMAPGFRKGVMEITPLFIDAFTVYQFRNLIALEKSDPHMEPQAIAIAQFMDYIINTSKDVALLRKKGIMEHALGSDEEIATIFNQLTSGTLEYRTPELERMYKDVDEYCKTNHHRWRAILMRDYFGSPWTAISLVAAVILLSLTFIQTFFSMYAYFKPPSAT